MLETNNEITDRKGGQEALRRANRELRALTRCNQALQRATDEQSLLEQICGIICDDAGYRAAWVSYIERDEAKGLRPVAWAGTGGTYLANARIVWPDETDYGRGAAIRSGNTCCVQDFATDPCVAPWRELLLRGGFRSGIVLPLKDEDGNVFGALTLHSAHPNAFTLDEVRLIEELAGDLEFGIVALRSRAARKLADEAMRRHEQELRQVLDISSQLVAEFGPNRERVYANRPTLDYFGVTLAEWRGISDAFHFYHPDDRKRIARDAYTGDLAHEFEARLRRHDGTYRWFLIREDLLRDEHGRPMRLYLAGTDIEDRKRAEEDRRQSAERFRAIADYTYDWENWFGVDGKLLWVNSAVERITGYSVGECMAMPDFPMPIVAAADQEPLAQEIREAVQGSSRNDVEFRVRHKNGRLAWVAASWQPIYDSQGGRLGYRSSIRDIAERKRAEEALRQSESYLAEAQTLSHTGSWALDVASAMYDYVSDEYLRIFGFDRQDGMPTREAVFQRIHPEDRNRVEESVQTTFYEKADSSDEYRIVLPDGTVRDIYTIRHPVLDADGNIAKMMGTSADITERKRAEESLRENEVRFRTLVDHAADALIILDAERGIVVDLNQSACQSLGYTRQELIGKRPDFFHPHSDEAAAKPIADPEAASAAVCDMHWHQRKDGTKFPVEVSTSSFTHGGRRFVLRLARDISDRLRAEEAIRQSEKQLRNAIDTIPALVWSTLADGSVDFVNRRTLEFTGLSFEKAIGEGWQVVIHPEDRERYLEVRRAAVASGQTFELEARLRRADGEFRWMLLRSVPLRDNTGTVVKRYGVSTDIDDRKRAEQALRESEAYLAEAEMLTHTGSWAFDVASNRYIHASDECLRIFGVDPKGPLPTRKIILLAIHPDDSERVNREFEKSVREKVDVSSEFRIALDNGTLRYIQTTRHPVPNAAGEVVRIVGTVVDITDRKRAEEERERLRRLEADLRHLNRVSMLGELAASVAHEVNQPISGVVSNGSACLRWLARDVPDLHEAREAARRIVRDGKRAGEIIARIRGLATRNAAMVPEKLDLNETIQAVIALVGDEARKQSVTIRTEFAADIAYVRGDRVQLQQVALNLIMNAIEAMSSTVDRPRELVVTTRNIDARQVAVTVEDSGLGVDPENMEKIFDSFYTTKPGGMGMGLSISRSILQAHGGRLWAASKDRHGTKFHFTVPKYDEGGSNGEIAGT